MGEKIWASFKGTSPQTSAQDRLIGQIYWKKNPALGWTQAIGFSSLKNLYQQIRDNGWQVDKLGIIAHGGQASGRIDLDRRLSMRSIESFKQEFRNLASLFTKRRGRLIFFSCGASAGSNGDELWCKLSQFMPNCEIVGFSKILLVGRLGSRDFTGRLAGMIWEYGDDSRKYVNEWSPIAKWAKNDYIVRPTTYEVKVLQTMKVRGVALNPKKLCGSINCLGHKSFGDRCKVYHRLPSQFGKIMASYYQARQMYDAEAIAIPALLGATDECGNLALTGYRNRALIGGQLCRGHKPFRTPGSLGRSRRRR